MQSKIASANISRREKRRLRKAVKDGVPSKEISARMEQSKFDSSRNMKAGNPSLRASRRRGKRWSLGLDSLDFGPLSVDGLRFSSRNATVGVAPRSINIQSVMPRMRSSHTGAKDILEGTELIGSVNVPAYGAGVGDILFRHLINPSVFARTRIAQFAPLYQRYRFKKLLFVYEPIANATQSGQIIGFADYDPDNILDSDDVENVQTAAAHYGEKISQVWEARAFRFGVDDVNDGFTTLYTSTTDAEARLIYQGVFYLIAASDLFKGSPTTTPLGNIYIQYEVEFSIPQLDPKSTRPEFYVASGWWTARTPLQSHDVPTQWLTTFSSGSVLGYIPNLTMTMTNHADVSLFTVNNIPLGEYELVLSTYGPAETSNQWWLKSIGATSVDFTIVLQGVSGCAISYNCPPIINNPTGEVKNTTLTHFAGLQVSSSTCQFSIAVKGDELSMSSDFPTGFLLLKTSGAIAASHRAPARLVAPLFPDHGRLVKDEGQRLVHENEMQALSRRLVALERTDRARQEAAVFRELTGDDLSPRQLPSCVSGSRCSNRYCAEKQS